MTAGLLAAVSSSDQLEAILAHELGHYYMGHAYGLSQPPSYFYNRLTRRAAFRPQQDHSLDKLGQSLFELQKIRSGRSKRGYFDHSIAAQNLVASVSGFGAFKDSWVGWKFDQKVCGPAFKQNLESLDPYLFSKNPSSADKSSAQNALSTAIACAQTIIASDGKYLDFFGMGYPSDAVEYLLGKYRIPTTVKNAWEAYLAMQPVLSDAMIHLHENPGLKKIGYYTMEEEADVFALNYVMSYGISQHSLQEGLANLVRFELSQLKVPDPEDTNCINAFENGWKLNGKDYVPLPLDFSDPHHGLCFRMYNADEIAGHLGRFAPQLHPNKPRFSAEFQKMLARYGNISTGLRATANQ